MYRREFLGSSLAFGAGLCMSALPAWARSGAANNMRGLSGQVFDLAVGHSRVNFDGRAGHAVTVNGQLPAPLLRWREGDDLTLRVSNHLKKDTSIHWHGLLLPPEMDGVPGVSFAGIKPGETFTYRFPLKQAGTYWYHSHSGLQEQLGHYGPIVIEPREPTVAVDREYVLVLSDWTFENPHKLFAKLKKHSDIYNTQQLTVKDFIREAQTKGWRDTWANRQMWANMRMNPTDIADVTGATYTYLVNGHSPAQNWTALFTPGERIRLRFINASAMSIFNVRIPGLPMTVVAADGLDVQALETDEFQIGTAETFDFLVTPQQAQAYTVMCESNDRSGYALASLAPREGMRAAVPALRKRPLLRMKDMAMDHGEMDHGAMGQGDMSHGMDHSDMKHDNMMRGMDHSKMNHAGTKAMQTPAVPQQHLHPRGPGVVGLAMNPSNRLHERPLGLEQVEHRVLVYTDLKSVQANPDQRLPGREMELHLTSNMERYMWSFDGIKFSEVDGPIEFKHGERLRLTLVNDTMMPHPIHLHGMFFDVVVPGRSNKDTHRARKHTIVVKPGEKLSVDISADALGEWAFHCHLLYHMHAGMMRVVRVA